MLLTKLTNCCMHLSILNQLTTDHFVALCSDKNKKVGIQLIIDISGSIGSYCPTVGEFSKNLGCTLLGAIPNLIIGGTTFHGTSKSGKYSSMRLIEKDTGTPGHQLEKGTTLFKK